MAYVVILIAVLLISPFILKLASSQDKKTKYNLRIIFLTFLTIQIILGFFGGLQLFLVISTIQIILLLVSKSFNTAVVFLNFINSVLIFVEMIRLSNSLGYQVISLPAIGAVFLVLFGNIIGLAFINKDKNLLKKYFRL